MASEISVFISLVVLSSILQVFSQEIQGYAILHASVNGNEDDFCVMFNPQWRSDWSYDLDKAPKYPVAIADPPLLCSPQKHQFSSKSVIAERGNCTFFEKGMHAQEGGAAEAIIVNYENKVFMPQGNASAGEFNKLNIPLLVLAKNDGDKLKSLGKNVRVQIYQPPSQPFDGNIVILWVLAVSTVAIGGFWSGISNKRIFAGQLLQRDEGADNNNDDGTVRVTPIMVLVFVILICGLLLLLFYFYKYLVYVIIVLFVFASCSGLFECLMPLVLKLPFGACKFPPNNLPGLKKQPEIRLIILALFCMAFAIWWGIERNASYAWILQDILGIAFCISLIKNIRLPNLKVCVILLVLLLIYDIFFVFITPLFSASGKSVMVEVATGKDHKEQLPMVVKIPRLTKSVLSVCARPYSLLGFGDILVPGLYIGFCHSFDTIAKTPRRIYFIATTIAYGVGLILTFIALFLMKSGQPALLYLVPCVLLTGVVIGWWRGELRKLWTGKMVLTARHERLALKEGTRNATHQQVVESLGDLARPGALTSDSEDEILNRTRPRPEGEETPDETDRLIN